MRLRLMIPLLAIFFTFLTATAQTGQKILPPAEFVNSEYRFGWSIAQDGDTAVFGAYGENRDNKSNVGVAYVYTRQNGTWAFQQRLTAPDGLAEDEFGWSVDIDGSTIAVGAWGDPDEGSATPGAVYIYENEQGTWNYKQTLVPSSSENNDQFGFDIQLTDDTLLASAPGYGSGLTDNSGRAYVFTRGQDGMWTELQVVAPSDPFLFKGFGTSVAFEGSYMLVGAPGDGAGKGAVYPFTLVGGEWLGSSKFAPADGEATNGTDFLGDFFGTSVDIEGSTAVIGAWQDRGGLSEGSVYVYTTTNGTSWTQYDKLLPDATLEDGFGFSVGLEVDTLLISADDDDINENPLDGQPYPDGAGDESGVLYHFQNLNGTWTQVDKYEPSDSAASDFFGMQFDFEGDEALVGAWGDDDQANESGSIYVVNVTYDVVAPTVSTDPVDGAEVARDANITLTFSEPVTISGQGVTFVCQPGNLSIAFQPTITSQSITLNPISDLPAGADCTLSVPVTSVTDAGDNALVDNDGQSDGVYQLDFRVNAPPQFVTTNPTNNADNVPVASNISLTLSERLSASRQGVRFVCQPGNVPVRVAVSRNGTTYTLDPRNDLPLASTCTLSIPTTNIVDSLGAVLLDTDGTEDGIYRLQFQTETGAPYVVNTSPTNNAVDVALDANVSVTVSESVSVSRTGVRFVCQPGSVPVRGRVSVSGLTYTLNPRENLPADSVCTLSIPTSSMVDADGNELVGNDGDFYRLTFDTGPTLEAAATAVEETELPAEEAAPPVIQMDTLQSN